MTCQLEKINISLLHLKWRTDDLLKEFENETLTAGRAKIEIKAMNDLIVNTSTKLTCYIEVMKNDRRERRQRYRKNKKERKMDQSSLATELYRIKL